MSNCEHKNLKVRDGYRDSTTSYDPDYPGNYTPGFIMCKDCGYFWGEGAKYRWRGLLKNAETVEYIS